MVEFCEQLRRAREAKGMTQQSLAEQLHVTRQSVSRWECGDWYPDLLLSDELGAVPTTL
ncbi:helix-turn-helix transcriptional regulator [Bacillota bacterium LCP21S3_F9]